MKRFGIVHELTIVALAVLTIVFFVFIWINSLPAQCPSCRGGQCAAPPAIAAPPVVWKPVPGDPDQIALTCGNAQLGNYDYSTGVYRECRGDTWGPRQRPPVDVPARQLAEKKALPCGKPECTCGCPGATCRCAVQAQAVEQLPEYMTHGVDRTRLARVEMITLNGQEVNRADAFEALAGAGETLPEDKDKPYLIAVFDAATLAKAKTDTQALTGFRRQFYQPDAPMVKDRDGTLMYKPGLHFVRADGAALSYSATWPEPAGLALAAAEALRRSDPKWTPDAVPDLTKPPPPPAPKKPDKPDSPAGPEAAAVNPLHVCGSFAVGGLLIYALMRRRESA